MDALGQPIGRTTNALDALQITNRGQETNMADLVTDAYRTYTGADAAIINGGAIRSNSTYGPGPLTRRDIMAILPYQTPVVAVKIPGRTLRQALEYGLAKISEDREEGRFPQVSGIRYTFDGRKPPGSRLVEITVGGKGLEDGRTYILAVDTYLMGGGDGYGMLKGLEFLRSPEEANVTSAVVIDFIDGKTIAPATDGRIKRLDP